MMNTAKYLFDKSILVITFLMLFIIIIAKRINVSLHPRLSGYRKSI